MLPKYNVKKVFQLKESLFYSVYSVQLLHQSIVQVDGVCYNGKSSVQVVSSTTTSGKSFEQAYHAVLIYW